MTGWGVAWFVELRIWMEGFGSGDSRKRESGRVWNGGLLPVRAESLAYSSNEICHKK